jgi:dTMP kinase
LAGKFVVLEGPDGSGKTTQAARLVEWLRDLGLDVVPIRDPGGTALGARLRDLLKGRSECPIGMMAEMLLFMASRAQLVEEVVTPALERGSIVVGDRFLLSNVVYQGYAGGIAVERVWEVGQASTGGLMPDLTILIDVPAEVAQARIGPGRDRIEDRGEAYRTRVREGYRLAAANHPGPIVTVDGSGAPDKVAEAIRSEVARVLALDPRA